MANSESLKVSPTAKEFLKQMLTNRIKLDMEPLPSFSAAIELIQKYFKAHNSEYIKMLKEEKDVQPKR